LPILTNPKDKISTTQDIVFSPNRKPTYSTICCGSGNRESSVQELNNMTESARRERTNMVIPDRALGSWTSMTRTQYVGVKKKRIIG